MKADEITRMIESGDFGPDFSDYEKTKIKEAWKAGRIREAQKMVNDIINVQKRTGKTLL